MGRRGRELRDDPLFRHPSTLRAGNASDLNLSVRGGTNIMGYFVSFNKSDEEGVFNNNFANRIGGRGNFDFEVAQTLNFSTQFAYVRTHLQQPLNNNASNGIIRNAMRGRARAQSAPWEPGFLGFSPGITNEFDRQNRIERMTIGVTGNWAPFDWLRHKLTLGLDKQNYLETDFTRQDTTGRAPWGAISATGTSQNARMNAGAEAHGIRHVGAQAVEKRDLRAAADDVVGPDLHDMADEGVGRREDVGLALRIGGASPHHSLIASGQGQGHVVLGARDDRVDLGEHIGRQSDEHLDHGFEPGPRDAGHVARPNDCNIDASRGRVGLLRKGRRHADVVHVSRHPEVFSSFDRTSLFREPNDDDELVQQQLIGAYDVTQPWGSVDLTVGASHFIGHLDDGPGWSDVSGVWENVVHHPSQAGAGLSDVDYGTIIDSIGNSV